MEDEISFARLQELYQPTMKKDRMYTQDLRHVADFYQRAYPAVRYNPPSFLPLPRIREVDRGK
jgi:hypothetical protein